MQQHTSPREPRARRSGWAIACLGAGFVLLSTTLVLALRDLQSMVARLFLAVRSWVLTLDLSIILIVLGFASVLTGGVLWHTRANQPAMISYQRRSQRSQFAPTVVYLDFENQGIRAPQIETFARFIKSRLGNGRIDLFFFANVTANVHFQSLRKAYHDLRRLGFTQMDIPHRPPDSIQSDIPNMVDMSLALHAMQRAMLVEEPQHFIFVAADLDYLPLIYTLLRMGHRVSVWARNLPPRYRQMSNEIGLEIWDYANIFPGRNVPEHPTTPRAVRVMLTDVLQFTVHAYDEAQAVPIETRREAFLRPLANEKSVVRQIGFRGDKSVALWLTMLQALDVFREDATAVPQPGPVQPEAGAMQIERILYELIASYEQLVVETGRAEVNLQRLGQKLLAEPRPATDGLGALRSLLGQNMRLLRMLCRCAEALGLIRLAEMGDHEVIITLHGVGA